MIDPRTALAFGSMALSLGSEVASAMGSRRARRDATAAADRTYEQTIRDLSARLREETTAAREAQDQTAVRGSMLRGQARLGAAQAGVGGRSVDLLLMDLEKDEALADLSLERNLRATEDQIGRHRSAAEVNRQNAVAGLPNYNPFLGALNLASTGLGIYGNTLARRPTDTTTGG